MIQIGEDFLGGKYYVMFGYHPERLTEGVHKIINPGTSMWHIPIRAEAYIYFSISESDIDYMPYVMVLPGIFVVLEGKFFNGYGGVENRNTVTSECSLTDALAHMSGVDSREK